MSVSVQAKKRQKCFMIDPKDGAVQEVPSFTIEEEQGFAISKLELWKKAGVTDHSEVMDPNHKKLQQFQDITAQISSRGGDKSVSMDAPTKMKNALESAQKAAAELSMLVQLSSLLQSNKILSLQTRYVDSSAPAEEPSSMDHDRKSSQDKVKALPVPQRIAIQRANFSKAKKSILSGLEQAQTLIKQRQEFASTLQQCKEDRSFSLCYVDRKTLKRVTHRKYEPRRDFIASDCSVHVPADIVVASNNTNTTSAAQAGKGGKWAARITDSSTVSTTSATTFVPILMGKKGIELSAAEQAACIYTLQFSLLAVNSATATSSSVGSATAWDILLTTTTPTTTNTTTTSITTHVDTSDMEIEDTNLTTLPTPLTHPVPTDDSVQALAAHCRRRKHETLCRATFARLKEECIRGAVQWDVLSGFSGSVAGDSKSGSGTDSSSTSSGAIGGAVDRLLRGADVILNSIVVVDVQERQVVLRVSETLVLAVALVPITDNSSSSSGVHGVEWVNRALSAMSLQALLETLQQPSATSSNSSISGGKSNNTTNTTSSSTFGRGTQWRALTAHKTNRNTTNSTTTSSTNSAVLTTRLLSVLSGRVEEQRQTAK